ncbi:MAG: class I SAM-dependent methyltransferase [Propionibacteriaceae bacterium]|nr:class I SAM-dependent methyltransferase [Propionibacteriaceae bacterium]
MTSVTMIPAEALRWLAGQERTSILLMGAADNYAPRLTRTGHSVTVVDPDVGRLKSLRNHYFGVHVVAADGQALPFDPECFSIVLSIQNFHSFSGDKALTEWARVLKADGSLGLAYVTRDDSVPWVKRLKRLVQATLPEAMTGDREVESVAALEASSCFPNVESTSFRLWVPCTREQLQASAANATGSAELSPEDRAALMDAIGQLYDEYARTPDPLMLPYCIRCWRAGVDRTKLIEALRRGDEGLSISL